MLKKFIVFVVFAGLVIYIGILYGTPPYHYNGIKSDIEELVMLRNMSDKELREEVKQSIEYYGVPVKMSKVSITRDNRRHFIIRFSWQETVNFMDLYEKKYKYTINMKGKDL